MNNLTWTILARVVSTMTDIIYLISQDSKTNCTDQLVGAGESNPEVIWLISIQCEKDTSPSASLCRPTP